MPVGQNDNAVGNPAWIWTNRSGYSTKEFISPGGHAVFVIRQPPALRLPFRRIVLPLQPAGGGTSYDDFPSGTITLSGTVVESGPAAAAPAPPKWSPFIDTGRAYGDRMGLWDSDQPRRRPK